MAVLSVLAVAQGTLAQCTGWQATPEARRQCCQSGACTRHEPADAGSQKQISQADADDCCAQSQGSDSSPSGTTFASSMTLAVSSALPPVILAPVRAVPVRVPWQTPSPPSHVPRHLLLSVLLV